MARGEHPGCVVSVRVPSDRAWSSNRWILEPLYMVFPVWFAPFLLLMVLASLLLPWPWTLVAVLAIYALGVGFSAWVVRKISSRH